MTYIKDLPNCLDCPLHIVPIKCTALRYILNNCSTVILADTHQMYLHRKVEQRAYYLSLQFPQHTEMENWLQAEHEISNYTLL